MKKIYILTCVDINADLVCIKSFKDEESARKEMEGQFHAEEKKAKEDGCEIDDYFSGIEHNTAGIKYGDDVEFKWVVSEVWDPVAEDKEQDELKWKRVREAISTAEENRLYGNIYSLTESVNDYDSFYLDDVGVFVWNNKKNNYRNIMSTDVDSAEKIARQIINGDYEFWGTL